MSNTIQPFSQPNVPETSNGQSSVSAAPTKHEEAAAQTESVTLSQTAQSGAQLLAAAQLRLIEQEDAAGLAEALRMALTRFAKKSVANRRAQQLNRGLNTALKSLQALGVQESGRLIAEA
jgi:hypothetical protein